MSALDPGCVKTQKGRSRGGIAFYRRRVLHSVLPSLAMKLVEKQVFLRVPRARAF